MPTTCFDLTLTDDATQNALAWEQVQRAAHDRRHAERVADLAAVTAWRAAHGLADDGDYMDYVLDTMQQD